MHDDTETETDSVEAQVMRLHVQHDLANFQFRWEHGGQAYTLKTSTRLDLPIKIKGNICYEIPTVFQVEGKLAEVG